MLELKSLNKNELQELYAYLSDYKILFRDKIDVPENLSFGIEIEYSGIPFTKANMTLKEKYPKWYTYKDQSVTTDIKGVTIGAESTSPIMHDKISDWQELKEVYGVLNELGASINRKCAFHVHIGAQILEENLQNVKNLIKMWCVFEPTLYRFGYGDINYMRDNMFIFTPPLRYVYTSQKLQKHLNSATTTKELDFGKRWALSFHNLHYLSLEEIVGNDLEIRICNGTLNPIIAQNYINTFLKLILYVKSNNYDTKLIDKLFKYMTYYNLESYSSLDINNALLFADLVFTNDIDKMNFLATYFKREDYPLIRTLRFKENFPK